MRVLGIDYGTKRVGLALSDESATIAQPLTVIPNVEALAMEVVRVCSEKEVEQIVIGESKRLDGTPNPLMEDITNFIDALNEKTDIPIALEPEFWSSEEAERFQGKDAMLDARAAAIMLQRYLDKHK